MPDRDDLDNRVRLRIDPYERVGHDDDRLLAAREENSRNDRPGDEQGSD